MNKKIMTLSIVILMLLSVCGCGQKKSAENKEEMNHSSLETTLETTIEPTEAPVPGVHINENPVERDSQQNHETEINNSVDIVNSTKETSTQDKNDPVKETESTAEKQKDQSDISEEIKPNNPEIDVPKESIVVPDTTLPSEEPSVVEKSEYEIYQSMSGREQKEYMESFDSIDAFFDWYNNAKEEYEANNKGIVVGGGSIDLGELITE